MGISYLWLIITTPFLPQTNFRLKQSFISSWFFNFAWAALGDSFSDLVLTCSQRYNQLNWGVCFKMASLTRQAVGTDGWPGWLAAHSCNISSSSTLCLACSYDEGNIPRGWKQKLQAFLKHRLHKFTQHDFPQSLSVRTKTSPAQNQGSRQLDSTC